MRNRIFKMLSGVLALVVLALPRISLADAEPLTLFQLDNFSQYLGCLGTGGEPSSCPEENVRWEKDRLGGVTAEDYALALREYWDDAELTYVCYKNRHGETLSLGDVKPSECDDDCAVVPHSLCDSGAADCLAAGRTPSECEDVDGDGIRRWQEDAIGSSDFVPNNPCDLSVPATCGFAQECTGNFMYVPDPAYPSTTQPVFDDPAHAVCAPRSSCPDGACTAFHLEIASVNNNELIVYVVFDYAPVAPTILDLYVDYDFSFMTLVDARLMEHGPCTAETGLCNKALSVGHPSDNRLRLTVLSPTSDATIPMGQPIIELVFDRIANGQTKIAFTGQDHLQVEAMAPGILDEAGKPIVDENGTPILNQLADDALWGDGLAIPAVDPNGPRLLLYYSFDNAADYLDYADVKDGAGLCELIGECSVLRETDDYQREQKEIYKAKLNILQRGVERISEQVTHGVIGPAGYLDGKTDHLEFPITVNDPPRDADGHYYYDQASQSFSLSTWFYAEGDSLDVSESDVGQILFSRNNPLEETKFGISLKNAPSDLPPNAMVPTLFWFKGPVDETPTLTKITENLAVLEWTHLGVVFHDAVPGQDDDGDGMTDEVGEEVDRVNFYLDGAPIPLSYAGIDDDHDGETDEADEYSYDLPLRRNSASGTGTDRDFKLECPAAANAGGLKLHEEGKEVGPLGNIGAPEVLYFASSKNNQYGIETMDLYGFERSDILRDGITSAKEIDYSPTLDKIVYSSNKSGNYEIWIADGDGSDPKQITMGFGDTDRGVSARRPKWAPDGSAIVFDSNIYSKEYMDNLSARTAQLYYIGYNPFKNEVAVALEDGGTATVLDYDVIVANQTVSFYRLTSSPDRNSYGAIWISGKTDTEKGRLWFNSSSDKHDHRQIRVLTLPTVISGDTGADIFAEAHSDDCLVVNDAGGTPLAEFDAEYTLFDGYRRSVAYGAGDPIIESQIVFAKEWVTYEAAETAGAVAGTSRSPYVIGDITPVGDVLAFSVYFDPTAYDCFSSCDAAGECLPSEIPELYIRYDDTIVSSDVSSSIIGDEPGNETNDVTDPLGPAKYVKVYDSPTSTEQFVKIRVGSDINSRPICLNYGASPGVFLARLQFHVAPGATLPTDLQALFTAKLRNIQQAIGIADMTPGGQVQTLGKFQQSAPLDFIKDIAFSPDGNRLVMHGIENARPVVVVQEAPADIHDTAPSDMYNRYTATDGYELNVPAGGSCELPPLGFQKISGAPMNLSGMSWEKIERFYPCNWVGAHKERDARLFQNGFRGGMDELKLYSYARDPRGFLSDYERGHAWLEKEGRDGTLPAKTLRCNDHYDCPDYMLCMPDGTGKNECRPEPCDVGDATGCACDTSDPGAICGVTGKAGVCTLMSIPAAHGQAAPALDENGNPVDPATWQWEWVCVAECVSDTQCFKEECYNGPCRFCDNNACEECKVETRMIGSEPKREIVGCPDRNSWDCEDGTCVTECYSFENENAIYLCDPALEYCQQGRCKLFDWDWTDISPMTFSSIGDMSFKTVDTTVALDQQYPVKITAYGVEDYLTPPEILVEGQARGKQGSYVYDLNWFKIGHIQIYNKNKNEAEANPYLIYTPVPISDLRIRLVQPLYDNLTSSATGLGEWDAKRCEEADGCKTCTVWGDPVLIPSTGCYATPCEEWDNGTASTEDAPSCTRRAPGSRATVGYPVGIPRREARRACDAREMGSCHFLENDPYADRYLHGGQTAAIILNVEVAGTSMDMKKNKFCPYTSAAGRELETAEEGYLVADDATAENPTVSTYMRNIPTEDGHLMPIPVTKRIVYGPVLGNELSNQAARFYDWAPESINALISSPSPSQAILNCNFNDPGGDTVGENNEAVATYSVCGDRSLNECYNTLYKTTGRDGYINESANGCAFERGMYRTPCYEYTGNDVTLDFMTYTTDCKEPWRTLDFDLHRSFGYDEGSLKETKTEQGSEVPVI